MVEGMAIPCPCCKANNDAGPICRRCKADLGLLFAVEAERTQRVAEACRHLGASHYSKALAALEKAEGLRRGPDLTRLKAVAALLNRDFAAALAAHSELQ